MSQGATPEWKRLALVALIAASLTAVSFVRLPLLPAISVELRLSPAQVGLFTTVFGMGRLVTDLPVGRLTDRLPASTLLALGGAVAAAGSLGIGAAPNQWWLLAGALLLGIVSAATNATGMTEFSRSVTPARRGMALGLLFTATMAGQMLGPAAGGLAADRVGWRSTELAAGVIGLLVGASAVVFGRSRTGDSPDRRLQRDRQRPATSRPPAQGNTAETVALYLIPFSIFFAVAAIVQTLVPIVAAASFHLSAGALGLALGLSSSLRAVASVAGGWASDRWGRKAYVVPSLLAMAVASLILADTTSLVIWLIGLALLQAASTSGSQGTAMLADRSTQGQLGRELGRYRFVGDLGLVAGPVIVSYLLGGFGIEAAVAPAAVLMLLAAIAVAALLPETRTRPPQGWDPVEVAIDEARCAGPDPSGIDEDQDVGLVRSTPSEIRPASAPNE